MVTNRCRKTATRGFVVGFVVLLAVAALLTGDGKAAAQRFPPITILINDSPWLPGFEKLVKAYEEQTGRRVQLNITPFAGMLQKSRNAVLSNVSEFDIINLNEQWYMQFYANGWVAPIHEIDPGFELDPQIIEYEWATRWDPAIGYSTESGILYGLPINGNIQLFFYRADLLEEAGFAPPRTWDEVLAIARALHRSPYPYGYAVRSAPPDWELQSMLHGFGGGILRLDESTGEWEVIIDRPESLEGFRMWLNLGINYGPPNYANIGQADLIRLMASGRLVMTVIASAAAPALYNPETSAVSGHIRAIPVPGATPELRSTMSGIWVMGIPSNLPPERQSAALEFLKWALTKEAQTYYAESGAIPVRQDVFEELGQRPGFAWMAAMSDSTPFIKAQPRLPETPQILEVLNRRAGEALIGRLQPEQALREAAREIHAILQGAGYAVKPLQD